MSLAFKVEKKPRRSCSFRYHAARFLLEYLFLLTMISLTLESKCEYEDADLIWRNKPTYSVNDVKAMAWYKGKDSLIATWVEGKGFKEYPPYIGRLMLIGETGIKLRTANRSDSGSYWLSLTLESMDNPLEAITDLEVYVEASSQCKPTITEEGSILKAKVPSEGCGIPPLSPKWKNTSKSVIQELQNPSLLDLGRNFESGEYVVCAEGKSAICYQGNISDLCTGLTKSQHGRHDDGLTSNPVSITLPIVLVALIAIVVSIMAVILWKRKFSRGNRQSEEMHMPMKHIHTDIAEACAQDEEYPLIEKGKVSRKGFPEIKNYLRGLYKDMTTVSLSPTGKENFVDVAEVYIELDFQHIETRDFKYTETDLTWTTSCKASVSKEDIHTVKAPNHNVSPIIIVGCSGSGKSSWCKHLVQCWSQNSKIEDANIQGINLPSLGEYQVLLYLPLKASDRGFSFQELLQEILFQGQPEYLNIITKYMHNKSHAQSILILIDGFDLISEYVKPMSELLDHKLFTLCTVIFTCRPSSLKLIFNLRIMEHLLDSAKTDQRCAEKMMKLSQGNSLEVHTRVNKLNERFVKIKDLMYELSMTTEEIFLSKTKGLIDDERLVRGTSARGKDKLRIEVLYEIGIVTESLPLKSNESLSTLTFTNVLIYQLFLSMAIAFKKGHVFDYIVSDMEVALKHSMIIHMLWLFSPTSGKDIFVEMRRLKTKKREKTNNFRYSITELSKGNKHQVTWLQLLMDNGDVDDEKLLFLTNALRSMDSLTSLVLENNKNNDDLVFWLPCSQNLEKLALNISNCTLLLCPEWNNQIPLKLQEVVIKSVIISRCDVEVLSKAVRSCKNIKKIEMSPTVLSTGDLEIVS